MTVAISKALGEGVRKVICASTGNTAASAAAYAGRAGLQAYVLIPKGAVALGKLSQSVMHGARVVEVIGNFDICLKVVRDLAERDPIRIRLVNSVNPDRIAGQKTAASKFAINSVRRRPIIFYRWATLEILPLTGPAIANTRRPGCPIGCPG